MAETFAALTVEQLDKRSNEFERMVVEGMRVAVARSIERARENGVIIAAPVSANPEDDEPSTIPADFLAFIREFWSEHVTQTLIPWLFEVMNETGEFQFSGVASTLSAIAFGDELPTELLDRLVNQPLSTERYLADATNRLVNIGDDLWENARDELNTGIQRGESIPELAERVSDAVEVTEPRATTIARTEANGAMNSTVDQANRRVDAMFGIEQGIMKEWSATEDLRTRPSHVRADGQVVPLDESFTVGQASLAFPSDPTGPPGETINCVTGDTVVDYASLRGITRRWYVGDVINLRFASGDKLTVTPNHPILRSDGVWTPAGELLEGDECVYDGGNRWFERAPDEQCPPAVVGELYRAAREVRNPERVCISPPDFHGDGTDGYVDIVGVLGNLPFEGDPATDEEIAEFGLSLADRARTRQGGRGTGAFSSMIASCGEVSVGATGFIGGERELAATLSADALHTNAVGLTDGSQRQVKGPQVAVDNRTTGAQSTRHLHDTDTVIVERDNRANVELSTGVAPGLTRIEHVTRMVFSGHVYNLDTGVGWYNGNSITMRNCRCTTLTVISDDVIATVSEPVQPPPLPETAASYQEEEMPYDIVQGGGDCAESEWAVLKQADGEVMGCHDTEESARQQVAAIEASEAENGDEGDEMGTNGGVAEVLAADDPATERFVSWSGTIAVEGVPTGDGRQFEHGSLKWAELPMSLGWMYERSHGGMQTDKVVTVGMIDTIQRGEGGIIVGTGRIDTNIPEGQRVASMMGTRENPGSLAGISIDADDPEDPQGMDVEYVFPEGCEIPEGEVEVADDAGEDVELAMECMVPELAVYHSGRIRAATLVDIPAFVEARIFLDQPMEGDTPVEELPDEDVVVASSFTLTMHDIPPASWFNEPTDEPDIGAITVTDEGRIFGYLAPKHVAHRGIRDKRVEVPMKNVDYGIWMNRVTIADTGDGAFTRVPTGPITMDCGHAPMSNRVQGAARQQHYDNSCSVVATARVGENAKGVWIAGALLPDVTPTQVRRMMSLQLSGDWGPHREKPGKRELAGALLVPVPGYPKRSFASVKVKNGVVAHTATPLRFAVTTPAEPEKKTFGTRQAADRIAASVGRDRLSRVHELAAKVKGS